MSTPDLAPLLAPYAEEIVAFRRDLHAHPETGHREVRTTARIAERLECAGLSPQLLPGTGVVCDIGPAGPTVLLRADIDALPLTDESGLGFASTVPGISHACGHDVHTSAVLGAGLLLVELSRRGELPGRVRLVFQPAEEVMPGGALDVIAAGGLDGVDRAFALHCDPSRDVGTVSLRPGAITSAADHVLVRLHGSGGHTSRPHLTEDVVFALSQVATQLPAILSRRLDPRAGVALVWGRMSAGGAANAIPRSGEIEGTLRCLDQEVWGAAGALLAEVVHEVVRPYGVRAEVLHTRGVPPTVNDPDAVLLAEQAVVDELGEGSVCLAEQSLGGEDFAWILEKVPGVMMRLGTRSPGGRTYDLHQGDFVADERAIGIGARVLTAVALRQLVAA
ncbi:MAG TPA: amidohydrolase [Kineosporiaceae bacterium]|nr:amidohydrolase [Kineosporiaceae bacterium]